MNKLVSDAFFVGDKLYCYDDKGKLVRVFRPNEIKKSVKLNKTVLSNNGGNKK
jgi:hypothetical protein